MLMLYPMTPENDPILLDLESAGLIYHCCSSFKAILDFFKVIPEEAFIMLNAVLNRIRCIKNILCVYRTKLIYDTCGLYIPLRQCVRNFNRQILWVAPRFKHTITQRLVCNTSYYYWMLLSQ